MSLSLFKINIFIIIISCSFACKKAAYNPIPIKTVTESLNLSLPLYNGLTIMHNYYLMPSEGVKGLLVYHGNDGYITFDLCCSYQPVSGTIAVVLPDRLTAKCIACGSIFSLSNGQVMKGPASYPLRIYNTSEYDDNNGNTWLSISN